MAWFNAWVGQFNATERYLVRFYVSVNFFSKEYAVGGRTNGIFGFQALVNFVLLLGIRRRKIENLIIYNRSIWKETDAKSMRKGTLFQKMFSHIQYV
jgi:hypothetical protein